MDLFYESLGNKFILFDQPNHKITPQIAKELCKKHSIDGVLIVHRGTPPSITMFNADGSDGQLCLNGARCVAHYLHTKHNFPNQFDLLMGNKTIATTIEGDLITQKIPLGASLGAKKITCDAGEFCGHVVDVGNPHFIIFQKQNLDWLTKNGHLIESHTSFPNKTNVEFVWPTGPSAYTALIYERGCGVTQACSSGAAAITQLLHEKKLHDETAHLKVCMESPRTTAFMQVQIRMLGGTVTCWITDNQIALRARVT